MGKRTNSAVWFEKYSRWQINVQKDGRRRSFTSSKPGRTGQREANAKADEWLDEGIEGQGARIERLLSDYVENLKLHTSKSHYTPEGSRVKFWLSPLIGNLKIENITEQHCQDIVNKAYAAGLSRKTLKNIRATIVAFFKYCRKRKLSKFNPEDLIIPKGAKYQERSILKSNDLAILFANDTTIYRGKIITDIHIDYYRFVVVTGYRPGEVLGFVPSDFDGGVLSVNRSVNIYGEVTSGKNKNAKRSRELHPIARSIWEKRIKEMDGTYVFGEVKEKTLLNRWKVYCSANGITPTTLYELRHTFVSIVQSLPEAYVKNLVGHSKAMDTGTYTHETDNTQKEIAQMVQQIFSSVLSKKSI